MTKVQIPTSTSVSGDGEGSNLRIRQPVEAHSRLYTRKGWCFHFASTIRIFGRETGRLAPVPCCSAGCVIDLVSCADLCE
jgi:hypothetical protein